LFGKGNIFVDSLSTSAYYLYALYAFLQKANAPKIALLRTFDREICPKTHSRPHSTKTPLVPLSWALQTASELLLTRFAIFFVDFLSKSQKKGGRSTTFDPPNTYIGAIAPKAKVRNFIRFRNTRG
ncbi:MAG: hypothetical protein IIW89_01860, partial [Alistipes sp.]|nr:hypothetical protein [Alistipes sp.]